MHQLGQRRLRIDNVVFIICASRWEKLFQQQPPHIPPTQPRSPMNQSTTLNSLQARRFAASLAAPLQQGCKPVMGAFVYVVKAAPPGPPGS